MLVTLHRTDLRTRSFAPHVVHAGAWKHTCISPKHIPRVSYIPAHAVSMYLTASEFRDNTSHTYTHLWDNKKIGQH